jgi:hypothetical protein
MSEFKFACPICGQHITADSADTGTQIPCPTCFRKLVVPQAPASEERKFVLSASEASKPRPLPVATTLEPIEKTSDKTPVPIGLLVLLGLALVAGGTLFALRKTIFHSKPAGDEVAADGGAETNKPETQPPPPQQQADFTGTSLWTLDLSNAKFPDTQAAGAIHGKAFTLERATLSGSNLTLRVGRSGAVELGVTVYFFNHLAEELSGKTAEVKPDDTTAPRVVMHWRETDRMSKTFHDGYAMKVEFGAVANNSVPGKIFLCVPDDTKSWIAGTFRAEIRKPAAPKPKPQAAPAPARQTQ